VTAANGVLLIQGLGKPKGDSDDDDDDKGDKKGGGDPERVCELAPAFGAAPTRLVCGWSAKALGELGPWLTRTATRLSSTSDAHVEVQLAPFKDGINLASSFLSSAAGDALAGKSQVPGVNEAISAIVGDLGDFARDMSSVALDVQLSDAGATLSETLKMGGTTSQIARVLTAHPERNGPPPPVFWQLPGDADQAWFARGEDDVFVTKLRGVVQPLLTLAVTEAGLKEADRKLIIDGVSKWFTGVPGVVASGIDADSVRKTIAAVAPMAGRDDQAALDARHAAAEALFGWHVFERDEPVTRTADAIKDLAAILSRPTILAAIRGKNSDMALPTLRSAPQPKGVTLPAGSLHYVAEVPQDAASLLPGVTMPLGKSKPAAAKKAPKPKPFVFHVLVVPDGARSWVGIGGDEGTCASRLATAMGTGGDKLEGRADLAALKQNQNLGAAGFFTIRGFLEGFGATGLASGAFSSEVVSTYERLLQLPHQALSPIPFSFNPQAGPVSVVASTTLPKGAIEDTVTYVVKHGGF
jgi:hypothetical protein